MKTTITLSAALLAALTASSPLPQTTAAVSCKTYTLLFARGTTEVGTLGTIVGPGLQTAVESALGADQVTVQGVEYAADIAGIIAEVSGSGPGSVAMAADAATWLSNCPDTQLILTGYSQGALVVHNTASKLETAGTVSSVVAAVTFGDPFKTQLPDGVDTAEFHTFCATGDTVCGSVGTCAGTGGCTSKSTLGHLGYGADADTAAAFIESAVGASASISGGSTATASATATTTIVATTAAGIDLGTGLGAGFSIPTALPTLGSGLGSGFSIPGFTIPTSLPTGFPGLGKRQA